MKRLLLAGALLAAGLAGIASGAADVAPAPGAPRVLVLDIHAPITTGVAEYVEAGLERARREGFSAVAISLDTPGGHLEATRDIVQRMLASEVPVVVWVGPAGARAASAGVFITMAADVALMHPTSVIGAAHPVLGGGQDVEKEAGKDMARKVENDTAAFARTIAATRGRNADWAEKAVRESVSATAEEAVRLRVVDGVADSLAAALAQADGRSFTRSGTARPIHSRGAADVPAEMTVRQRVLAFLSDPNVIAILMMLGTLGLALEFYHPGGIVPGALGAFFLLLAFLSMRVIPVNVGAVALILAGVALLVVEGFVTTHGVAGMAGAALVGIGMLFFIDRSSAEYRFDPALLSLSPWVIWPTPVALGGILGFVGWKVARTRREKLRLGAPGMVGEVGEATSDVGPEAGEVFVHGERWSARSAAPIARGAAIRVREVRGLVLHVEPEPGRRGVLP
ncbi:MAG TPA: nodulation protein NfeD [Anaeromyxobacteraceae bacterium]|nr:nodulation protein NfeD [Anaeromyxobacteraceae bacterium]